MKSNKRRFRIYRALSVVMLAVSAYLFFLAASKRASGPQIPGWHVEDILAIGLFLIAAFLLIFSTYRLKSDDTDRD